MPSLLRPALLFALFLFYFYFICLSGLLGMSDAQRKDVESVLAILPDMDVEVRF